MHADALEALYRDHYRAALLYALSLCGDRALAEDLVSDAFEAALLTLDDSHPSVRYWLLRVCRHLWLDELRRRKRRPTGPAEGLDLPVPEAAREGLLREERYAALYRALRKLPDQPRELLTLHYFSGLSLRRAGELTGMTEGAAKTALCRARQRLRTILEEGGYEI